MSRQTLTQCQYKHGTHMQYQDTHTCSVHTNTDTYNVKTNTDTSICTVARQIMHVQCQDKN